MLFSTHLWKRSSLMRVIETPLKDLVLFEPIVHHDKRGFFLELFQQQNYKQFGIPPFVQDNLSRSKKDVLRGLHYQEPNPQGKLVFVIRGTIWDVAVDIRLNSKTFGQWFGVTLSDQNHYQLYIPPGFAHGFCVLSEEADFGYKCTDYYLPNAQKGIRWSDSNINIAWPINKPILSEKDETYPFLHEITHERQI